LAQAELAVLVEEMVMEVKVTDHLSLALGFQLLQQLVEDMAAVLVLVVLLVMQVAVVVQAVAQVVVITNLQEEVVLLTKDAQVHLVMLAVVILGTVQVVEEVELEQLEIAVDQVVMELAHL
jgi:hypothetical protein